MVKSPSTSKRPQTNEKVIMANFIWTLYNLVQFSSVQFSLVVFFIFIFISISILLYFLSILCKFWDIVTTLEKTAGQATCGLQFTWQICFIRFGFIFRFIINKWKICYINCHLGRSFRKILLTLDWLNRQRNNLMHVTLN